MVRHHKDMRWLHINELNTEMLQVKEMANSEFLDLDSNLEANCCDLLVEKQTPPKRIILSSM